MKQQAIIKRRKQKGKPKQWENVHLFTLLIVCGKISNNIEGEAQYVRTITYKEFI